MRITQRTLADNNIRNMGTNLAAVAKLNDQITSGKAITKPSDNPSGTATAMRTRTDLAANDQYGANITQAGTTLAAADGALATVGDMLRRVRDLTTQAASTGSQSPESLKALSIEVAGLRDGLLAMANRTVDGRPVFGGATSTSQAYDTTTGAFTGRAGVPLDVRVSPTETVRTDVDGPTAFGPPGADVFALVQRIADEVTATPTGDLTASIGDVDAALSRVTAARTEVGVRVNRLDTVKAVNADAAISLGSQLGDVEDIDTAKAYLELKLRQNAYDAALTVSSQTIQNSLVDFIR
ncbi:flagellar hook-associated protein FlgL [Klenkia sp. PcliD-1-E]|uniref:flagellar hook-associated protein FlgL n=1 Tax=Klenkia sp. PcliD-1-E TaxID=2954492 RepID=UPI0020971639|nr:flagellar hook-associated protein FlgL [Klenkia sp. PcliD-1-E]MCO7222133.1 flagellar hook-associated protein FlgL [Klenkia sp. PcliD-1-E]